MYGFIRGGGRREERERERGGGRGESTYIEEKV